MRRYPQITQMKPAATASDLRDLWVSAGICVVSALFETAGPEVRVLHPWILLTSVGLVEWAGRGGAGCLFHGVDHSYEPDFLVRLTNGLTVLLEIKGFENNQDRAKHDAARRWAKAVNNWGQLGQWAFHVCKNPQVLGKELEHLAMPREA